MDLSTIAESYQFNENLIRNFTNLQTVVGTITMIVVPIWLFIKLVVVRFYKSFLWNRRRLKVTNVVFGVSSPNDFSSIKEVLVTNCSTSKIEISKIEITFLRKKDHLTLELWKSSKKPLLINPEESSNIEIKPVSFYMCNGVVCDITDLWFEKNFFFKIYTITGGAIEIPFFKDGIRKFYFSKKERKIIGCFRSEFGGIVYGPSWSHLLSVKHNGRILAGFLDVKKSNLTLINADNKKDSVIYHIHGLEKRDLKKSLEIFFTNTFPGSTFQIDETRGKADIVPVKL